MSQDLMPCPFCGGTNPMELWDRFDDGWIAHMHCPQCGTNGPEPMPRPNVDRAIAAAVEAWNTRAQEKKK